MIRVARRKLLAAALALAAVSAAAALYGTGRLTGNRADAACRASEARLAALRPLATGEVAAFDVADRARAMTPLSFAGPDGSRRSLDAFRGRTVLLNLWATWCEPCKREMPALDRLQASLGGPAFEVAAVNLDTRDLDRPRRWLRENGIGSLAYYSDKEAGIFQDLRRAGETEGLPTTVLIGPDGCRLGRLAGWAEWASPEGLALVRAALAVR